jgi:carboxyl-terminal processing protease
MHPHAPAVPLLLVTALAGAVPAAALAAQQRSSYEELQTFSAVLNHIRLNYVDTVTYTMLVHAAIDGVLASLDPHSRYESMADFGRENALERGELATTGIALEDEDGVATVLAVIPKTPGAKAGVQPGDRVVRINDTTAAGLSASDVQLRLAGEKGSKVHLLLERGSRLEPDTLSVTLKRDFFEARSVSIVRMVDPTTGYVRLEEFGPKAAAEIHDALKRLLGQKARQVILDLRGNPGGVVVSAVEIASELFPKGTVVFKTVGRKKDVDTTFVTKRDGDFTDLPLIVLIDGRSASASEALAASLQDHDRALLLGRRSFGKALIQMLFLLPAGDVVWLTVGRVITPSGRFIQRRYQGVRSEVYWALHGQTGTAEDTATVFRTDHGRPVRGGGGIAPDVPLPAPPTIPVWWSVAADSGFDDAVSDSVAQTLPAAPAGLAAWLDATGDWQTKLVQPFLTRVRARFHVMAQPDSSTAVRIARNLALRVVEVRWGPDAREQFLVHNDPDIRAALAYFPRLPDFLAGAKR